MLSKRPEALFYKNQIKNILKIQLKVIEIDATFVPGL